MSEVTVSSMLREKVTRKIWYTIGKGLDNRPHQNITRDGPYIYT